jgi:excisionase family DNA binding protein
MQNPFEIFENRLANIESLLLDIKQQKPATTTKEPDQKFTIPELAEHLTVSPATIRTWIQKRAIPHAKVGKRIIFSSRQIESWLKQNKRKTRQDIASDAKTYIKSL